MRTATASTTMTASTLPYAKRVPPSASTSVSVMGALSWSSTTSCDIELALSHFLVGGVPGLCWFFLYVSVAFLESQPMLVLERMRRNMLLG